VFIGVDLAGLLGNAWRAPKVGRCRVGWGMGGVSLPQPTRGSGERRELPQRGQSINQSINQSFYRFIKWILAYFEGHRTLIFVPI